MSKRVHNLDFPVYPKHVDASQHLFDAFDHSETEISAGWIVRLCKELGSWGPFTQAQLDEFYHRWRPKTEGFHFNRLIHHGGWVEFDDDGYHVTDDFIARCFKSRPKTG